MAGQQPAQGTAIANYESFEAIMGSEEEWKCPICMDLLYKPCVNVCGHVFCFWCMHRAMNPFQPSQCPMCRSAYTHFPSVCERLHQMLSLAYPQEYARREVETKETEARLGIESPDMAPPPPTAQAAAAAGAATTSCCSHKQQQRQQQPTPPWWLLCDNPQCRQLLVEPAVLSCGHVVCKATCTPGSCLTAAAGVSQHAASPAGGSEEAATAGGSQVQQSRRVSAGAGELGRCPACNVVAAGAPAACVCLEALLRQHFSAQQAERLQHIQAALAAASASASASTAAGADVRQLPAVAGAAPAAAAAAASSLQQRLRSDERPSMLLRNIRDYMRQHADSEYKWHMVGCDVCGVYPIVGRRFQCLDCPETIGYDLCGSCQDNSAACSSRGRFNQNHTAEHRMQKCEPQLDWSVVDLLTDSAALTGLINCLQAVHPELSVERLLALVSMQFGRAEDEEGEEAEQQGEEEGQQQQQQQQQQQRAGSGQHHQGVSSGEAATQQHPGGAQTMDTAWDDIDGGFGDGQAVSVPLGAILPAGAVVPAAMAYASAGQGAAAGSAGSAGTGAHAHAHPAGEDDAGARRQQRREQRRGCGMQ